MKNKIIWSICILILMLIIAIPLIPSDVTKQSDVIINTIDEVYPSGWILLVSSNIQGIDEGVHFGGMSNINVTATYRNTLIICTKPIWGSALITEDVDIQIQMEHFFGLIDKFGDSGEIIGICEDVSWKII